MKLYGFMDKYELMWMHSALMVRTIDFDYKPPTEIAVTLLSTGQLITDEYELWDNDHVSPNRHNLYTFVSFDDVEEPQLHQTFNKLFAAAQPPKPSLLSWSGI